MIEDCQVERFSGLRQLARGAAVGCAGSRIAAGMIVGKDYTGTAKPCRIL